MRRRRMTGPGEPSGQPRKTCSTDEISDQYKKGIENKVIQ
jgi:hypothetical protein